MNKFKILLNIIKDISVETPDAETLIFVRDNISKYVLNIDITSKPLKNKMIEINTKLNFGDKQNNDKQSVFEIIYASVVRIDESVKDKKVLEKIILFILITFLLNQLPLNSKNKIFLNISIGILISIILEKDILQRIETIFLFLTYYFIVMNVYTTRYSSIRFMILDKMLKNEKIPNEIWLFKNRAQRIRKKSTFMSKSLFETVYIPIIFFKKLFKIQ